MLQWLREDGCPWDENICMAAAEGGHLEMLLWARANGCPWDEYTRIYAKGLVLEWAVANGAPEF